MPAPEDHRGKPDEATPVGHVDVEAADRAEREPRSREPRHHAADSHVDVADAIDVEAERVRRLRVLPDGARPEARAGVEQVVGRHRDDQRRAVDEQVLLEENAADDRQAAEKGNVEPAEDRRLVELVVDGQHLAGDVRGEAEREEIDRHAGNDLVDAVGDDQRAEQEAHQAADRDGGDEADPPAEQRTDDRAGEGAGKQHPLDADVDHRHPLGEHTDQPAERDRHGAHHGCLEHAGQRKFLARRRPYQERGHR